MKDLYEELEIKLKFFDYIYPSISLRLNKLESCYSSIKDELNEMRMKNNTNLEHIDQYSKKIHKIEQFIIERGLMYILKDKL